MGRLYSLYKRFGGQVLLKQYWKTGFIYKTPFVIIALGLSNKALEIFRLSANMFLYNYLKKKYWDKFDKIDFSKYPQEHTKSNKVWVCWFQGMESAPLVVKRCYESMQKNLKKEEIILITDDNINDYVSFPDFILERYKSGAITQTHLTDLLRLELLTKYGGIWIDSTVLCTGEIPQYVIDSDLFFFRTLKPGLNGHSAGLSSWFISAKTNSKILIAVKEMMYEYWKNNKHLIEYFLLHNFLQLALDKFPEEEFKMVKSSNCTPHILQLDFFRPYNKGLYDSMKEQSFVHKLSYKFDEDDMNKKGSYYDEIINKGNC